MEPANKKAKKVDVADDVEENASVTTTVHALANAQSTSAEASYDDLTGAALTGLDADALAAEEELTKARAMEEEEARRRDAEASAGAGPLDDKKFKQLDALLDQTTIYSQFLSEQMDTLDEEVDADGNQTGVKKKKKKMTEAEELAATKAFLPLMSGSMRDYQLKGVKWLI